MFKRLLIIFSLVILVTTLYVTATKALNKNVDSGKFGFGSEVYPEGDYLTDSISLANDLPLDWVLIEIPWAKYYPMKESTPNWLHLDRIMAKKQSGRFAVLFSITAPPTWALTQNGPDHDKTNQFIHILLKRYPGLIDAIEIFPGANTLVGWGKKPDPRAYSALVTKVNDGLTKMSDSPILVYAGLVPQANPIPPDNMDDLVFLEQLYQTGVNHERNVISIRYEQINPDVSLKPDLNNHQVLRHYQEVRKVMLRDHQENDRIWITHLNTPSGKMNTDDASIWLEQAFEQMQSQLYLGVVIYSSGNPGTVNHQDISLIQDGTNYHPVYKILSNLISENSPATGMARRGRSKNGEMVKQLP